MKTQCFIFMLVLSMAALNSYAQNQTKVNYPGPKGESGKCYAQCLIPGDTTVTYETVETKPGWTKAIVNNPYPETVEVPYTKKEKCTTCTIEEKTYTRTEDREVIVEPGYWKYAYTPCEYEYVYDSIMVEEGCVKYEVYDPKFGYDKVILTGTSTVESAVCVPAQTKKVKQKIETKEACTDIEVTDYIWEDKVEYVVVQAAYKKWVKRKADKNCLSNDPEDCLVWCLVDYPEEKERCVTKVNKGCPYGFTDNGTYCEKVTTTPADSTTVETEICEYPAQCNTNTETRDIVETVDVKVLDKKGGYRKVYQKPKYKVIKRKVIKVPARIDSTWVPEKKETITLALTDITAQCVMNETPAVYDNVKKELCKDPEVTTKYYGPETKEIKKVYVSEESFTDWREVLCPADIDSYTISQIQKALQQRGYAPGPIDNVIGVQTRAALTKFQKDNGLPIGQLDFQTLRALGLEF